MFFDKTKDFSDPVYRNICNRRGEIDEINRNMAKWWPKIECYLDKNFKQEIRNNTQSRLWEFWLCAFFIDKGKDLIEKQSDSGPDFCIKASNGKKVWVEAISVNEGITEDKVETVEDKKASWVDEPGGILRLRSAIEEKHNKYLKYLEKGLIEIDQPYVIAIDLTKISYVDARIDPFHPIIVNAVYGKGSPYVSIDRDRNIITGYGYKSRKEITKKSGNVVKTDIFSAKEYAGISAVFTSYFPFIPKNTEVLGNNMVFLHNHIAENPLDRGWLKHGKEYYVISGEFDIIDWTNEDR